MIRWLYRVALWCRGNLASVLATLFFIGLGVGFWMAWPPLGLIIPCGIGFGSVVWSYLSGNRNA